MKNRKILHLSNALLVVAITGMILQLSGLVHVGKIFSIDSPDTADDGLRFLQATGVTIFFYVLIINIGSYIERKFQSSQEGTILNPSIALLAWPLMWHFGPSFRYSFKLGLGRSVIADERALAVGCFIFIAFIAFVLKYISFSTGMFGRKDQEDFNKQYEQLVEMTSESRANRILALRSRSNSLIFQGNILLALIVSVIIGAGYFVPIAGLIAGQDATTTNAFRLASTRVDALATKRDELSLSLNSIQNNIVELENYINKQSEITSNGSSGSAGSANSDINNKIIELSNLKNEEQKVTHRAKIVDHDLMIAEKLMPATFKELTEGIKDDSTTRLLVSANVTRFGVLVLVIYLVQILINLYRFNTRLAAYYRAVIDSLTLYDVKEDKIGELILNMAPSFDFGKEPEPLLKVMIEKFNESVSKILSTLKKPPAGN